LDGAHEQPDLPADPAGRAPGLDTDGAPTDGVGQLRARVALDEEFDRARSDVVASRHRMRSGVSGCRNRKQEERSVNTALWIAAGLLAALALSGAITKTFVSKEKLGAHAGGEWTRDASAGFVRTLRILEILAAIGLVLPAVLGVAPVMVAVTAARWIVLMVGAMITHGLG
jgi:hypothetical protein